MKHKDKEKPKYRSYSASFREDGTIYRCSSSRIIGEECCWIYNPADALSEICGGIINAKTEEKAIAEMKNRIEHLQSPPVGHINYNGKIMTHKEHYEHFERRNK